MGCWLRVYHTWSSGHIVEGYDFVKYVVLRAIIVPWHRMCGDKAHAAYRGRAHTGRAVARQHYCEYRQPSRDDRDSTDLDHTTRALALCARARRAVVDLPGRGAAHR